MFEMRREVVDPDIVLEKVTVPPTRFGYPPAILPTRCSAACAGWWGRYPLYGAGRSSLIVHGGNLLRQSDGRLGGRGHPPAVIRHLAAVNMTYIGLGGHRRPLGSGEAGSFIATLFLSSTSKATPLKCHRLELLAILSFRRNSSPSETIMPRGDNRNTRTSRSAKRIIC